MKRTLISLFTMGLILSACNQQPTQEPLIDVIDRGLELSTEQALLMAANLETQAGKLPKCVNKEGKLATSELHHWWCCGFFPGQLWYLYENNPTPALKKYAEMFTARVEGAKNVTYSHDVGFMLYCSYGNGYRITGNPAYKDVMVTGARSLATRYDSIVGALRSWDFNKKIWQYPVIIDNMMNLELFTWTSRATGDKRFENIAKSHADVTMKNHFRDDYSCYHVVSYDTITGVPHKKQTHQGFADESVWARGQGWAIYGYTMMYRETGDKRYFEQARNIANYLMDHPAMPADKVPYWDFDAPDIPNAPRDASAAGLMACALIELSQMDKGDFGKKCLAYAEDQIRSLTTPQYLSAKGENCNFTLMHCTGHFPNKSEVDVPISYGDYYYVEALMKMKKLLNKN